MYFVRKTKSADFKGQEIDGFPLIVSEETNIHWVSLNWFLDLFAQHLAVSTIFTYAQHLSDFFAQIEVDDIEISNINDSWLRAYHAEILSRGNTLNYSSNILRTVLTYLHWLENEKYVSGLIGEGKEYSIRIKINFDNGNLKHPLIKLLGSIKASRPASSLDWINIVKSNGPQEDSLMARFELMIDWCAVQGLRAMELVNLVIEQLPSEDSASKAIAENRELYITLTVTKGSKPRTIPLSSFLVMKTWKYIYTYRQTIINSKIKQNRNYKDDGYIFLSKLTATPLDSKTFSNQVRYAWKGALLKGELTEEEKVWAHGLRHTALKTKHKKLVDNSVERGDEVLQNFAGHSSQRVLDIYLGGAFMDSDDV